MKGSLVGLALLVVVVASGVGLWITWDSTQTSSADPVGSATDLPVTAPRSLSATTTPLPGPPPCEQADEPVAGDPATDWATTVIDTAHQLPAEFSPPDLVDATAAGFEARDQVRQLVVEDLAALREAAEANGTPLVVISGYRSHSYQDDLFQRRADEVGEEGAALTTARPGHSEHQLGTTVDVLDAGSSELTTDFAATPAGQWLAAHAHEFGFVLSYPDGADDRTCYSYEPWHIRYVGKDVAAEIHQSGTTPREWMLAHRAPDNG